MVNLFQSIKKRIFYFYLPHYVEYLNDREKQKDSLIPKHELIDEHIRNTIMLTNRYELLKRIPKGGVVAEVGVNRGEYSECILHEIQPKKFHLIDVWSSDRYPSKLENEVRNVFSKEIETKKIEINKGLSIDVLQSFPNRYFDFIYIDTDHSYLTTYKELKICSGKIKNNGIIAGHDYCVGQWNDRIRYGVIEAVHQFCREENWELLYLTSEVNKHNSYALIKISN